MPPTDHNQDERVPRIGEILDAYCSGRSTLAEASEAVRRERDAGALDVTELAAAIELRVAAGELPEMAATALLGEASGEADAMTRLRPAAKEPPPLVTRHVVTPTGSGATGGATASFGHWPDSAVLPARPGVGDVLRDRFVIESVIGEGGMGVVFRARDRRREEALDRNPYVAIKFLGDQLKSHPDALIALQREARRMQQLSHPHIASVHDFDRDGAHVYLVMELLEGDSLDRVLERNPGVGLPAEQARRLIEQAGRALRHAHSRGVVHSDFKPANVFLTQQGEVKIIDFGIARIAKDSAQGGDASLTVFDAGRLGAYTNAYASPEQILGTDDPHPKDDIYSFGLVVYEALTGRHPFGSKSAVEARFSELKAEPVPGLSAQQNALLASALAFDRKSRLDSVTPLIQAFALNDEPIVAMRDVLRPRNASDTGVASATPGLRRNQILIALTAVAGAGLLYYAVGHKKPPATVAAPPVAEAATTGAAESAATSLSAAGGQGTAVSAPVDVATGPQEAAAKANPAPAPAPARPKAQGSVAESGGAVTSPTRRSGSSSESGPADVASSKSNTGANDGASKGVPTTPSPAADEGVLYRWIDKNGDVQFGPTPPAEYADVAVKVVDF